MSEKRIYATIIGINNYPKKQLHGCVRDALAIDGFLRDVCSQNSRDEDILLYEPKYFLAPNDVDQDILDVHLVKYPEFGQKVILDPTFQNLTTSAFDHLKQAKDGDICLFYYSGHGSTIKAPAAFLGAKSKLQNETIVCVDSRNGARDLIDKEIAYLLWDVLNGKDVHCVVVMDCCFAGNNTRNFGIDTRIHYRHTPDSKDQVPIEQYLGYDKGFFTRTPEGGIDFPVGRYVHLAASMDHQTAQETANDGGLFTSQLLDGLKKGGTARSYRDLMQTTRVSVRNRNPNQIPVGFALDDSDMDQPFLGGEVVLYKPTFEIRFDVDCGEWVLYGGAVDGFIPGREAGTRVSILNVNKEFGIKEVFSDFSYLNAGETDLDKTKAEGYQAVVTKHPVPPMVVGLSEEVFEQVDRLDDLKKQFQGGSGYPYMELIWDREQQDTPFQIKLTNTGAFVLVRTGSSIPLFKRATEPDKFLNGINTVGKWMVVNELKNTNTKFRKDDFVFRLERIEGKPIEGENKDNIPGEWVNPNGHLPEEVVFSYKKGHKPCFRLSIGIHPEAGQNSKCFVSAIYLGSKYGINTSLIKSDVNEISKTGEHISLKIYPPKKKESSTIQLRLDEKYHKLGVNEICDYLKIIISDQPFNLDHYQQKGLELDEVRVKPRSVERDKEMERDIDYYEEDLRDQNDWIVFDTRFRIVGPNKGLSLSSNQVANFQSFEVEVPEGFEAMAYAITNDDIINNLDEIKRSKSQQSVQTFFPSPQLFGNANLDDIPFPSEIGSVINNSVQLLELKAKEDSGQLILSPGQEIKIKPKFPLGEGETIVPFGYDEESDLYFPIGYTDDSGLIRIEQLPPPSQGIVENLNNQSIQEKGLGSSIKLFFQKVIWSRVTGVEEQDRLTFHQRNDDGSVSEITYLGSERTQDKATQIAQVAKEGDVLLLIHGIIGDTKGMVQAVLESEALHGSFTGILSFDYENLASGIDKTAEKLKKMLVQCGFGESKRITILAHSMGGLVSRHLIEHLEGDRFVKKLIQCGTPNSGSELADFRRKVTGWLYAGLNGVAIFKPYMVAAAFFSKRLEKRLFHTLEQMDPDSDYLKSQLNATNKSRPDSTYYLIGGNTQEIAVTHPEDASLLERIFTTMKSRGIYTGLDLVVFNQAPNDMAVKVERMEHLPWGKHDYAEIFDCDHMSYFIDERCLEQLEKWIAPPSDEN